MSLCEYAVKVGKKTPKGFQVTPRRFETNCFRSKAEAGKMCADLKERGLVKRCRVAKDRRRGT